MAPPERKRANVFGEDDPSVPQGPLGKKLKGNSQGIPSYLPEPVNVLPSPPVSRPAAALSADIAAKRAEFQAKLAAMTANNRLKSAAPPPPPPSSLPPPPPPPSSRPSSLPPVPGLPKPNLDPDLARKVAEARKMVEIMQAKKAAAAKPANPYLSATAPKRNDPVLDPSIAAHGGLSMAAHPLLMDNSAPVAQTKKERYRPMVPKFSTTKANARLPPPPPKIAPPPVAPEPDLIDTPFYDPRLAYGSAGQTGKSHMGKGVARTTLKFNQKGKFVKIGEAIRAEAKMEDLKRRILESAKKAGLESELEDQAKAVKRPAPPDVEWWDTPFLPEKSYDSFSSAYLDSPAAGITLYIQHPIQIPAPQDKIKVEAKPLFLTQKEMKKMRRLRRRTELQDKQDRIKMGLLPPDAPKVRLSNMMRVLTQDAIADPTKVEAKVRREMEAREKGHKKMNAERKLSDEARKVKEEEKKLKDEAKGIHAACFKIRYLSNKQHKSKIRMNTEQQNLTGVTLFNPKFNLVLVEGGAKAIKFFKRLMLVRIDWTEEALPRDGDEAREASTLAIDKGEEGTGGPMDNLDEPESLADNYCTLVWEGQHREKMFRYFKLFNCPSESMAKEVLGPKLEGLWDIAKAEVVEEE